MGLKVPAPTWSESRELATPAPLRRSRSAPVKWSPAVGGHYGQSEVISGSQSQSDTPVKWSPAVGAATLPSCAAEA